MQRGSSVNFQPIKLASHAVSHAARGVQPQYLLPPDKSLGTIIFIDDHGKVASTLEAKLALASRQAKRQGDYSPLWEGVINLRSPKPGEDEKKYKNSCLTVIAMWCDEYTKMTGHKVLRADIHLDEGRLDQETGEIFFNAHAHVMCDKTNDLGRVLKVNAPTLRKIQDFTSEITGLKRGENSLKTGLKHISHQQYKALAEKGRLETQKQVDVQKGTTKMYGGLVDSLNSRSKDQVQQLKEAKAKTENFQAKLDGEPARLDAALKAQEAQLNEQYRSDREALKTGAEKAKQADYQALKKAHEADLVAVGKAHAEQLEALKTNLAKAQAEAAKVPELVDKLKTTNEQVQKMDEYTKTLNAQLAASNEKIATELVAKAKAIEALVQSGEKSAALLVTAEGHRAAAEKLAGQLEVRHDAFKVKAQAQIDGIVDDSNEKIGKLEADKSQLAADLATAKRFADMAPSIKPAALTPAPIPREATRTAPAAPKQVQGGIRSPTPSKTPKEAFLDLYGHIKTVLAGLIDGMRLDAAEGRLGLFSSHSRTGPRVQVLCEVPEDKVMPVVGQCFDSRARPGKGGIGD